MRITQSRNTHLLSRIDGKDRLLELKNRLISVHPNRLPHTNPLSKSIHHIGRLQSVIIVVQQRRVKIQKGRVPNGRQDVEVGQGAYNAEEDNGLDGRVRCVQRERAKQCPHLGRGWMKGWYDSKCSFFLTDPHFLFGIQYPVHRSRSHLAG
jgi:hypothetical protein